MTLRPKVIENTPKKAFEKELAKTMELNGIKGSIAEALGKLH